MHWWAQQHKKAWTSKEDNSGGWSENPLHGKKKTFHNIQNLDDLTCQKTSKKARPLLEKHSLDGWN